MMDVIQSPAEATYWFVQGRVLFAIIPILGVLCFAYIIARRMTPLLHAERDSRFDHPWLRLRNVLQFWVCQWRHPRYRIAGTIHILIFSGFMILVLRALYLMMIGVDETFVVPGEEGILGHIYRIVRYYAGTIVLITVVVAIIRRVFFQPARYAVAANRGKTHRADAIFLLSLIGVLMASDALFDASEYAAQLQVARSSVALPPLTLVSTLTTILSNASVPALQALHLATYAAYILTFFFLLCYRPFGIEFHVEVSFFTIFFAKLDRANLKPVRWDVSDSELDQVKSFGVKSFEEFTWKHMLDFYSCVDCGRCSDQCPANAAGRPLSPRFLTIKARDYAFEHYPMFGRSGNGTRVVGGLYTEDEIWSCTTCGACEAECPLLVEYIDKIVDMRRGMIDDGNVPQSLQKPLKALENRGNPYGKPEKKRGDWAKNCGVAVLNGKNAATETLYFVDSVTSYDDRIQAIGRATARILAKLGENFGVLGAVEKDSGHDVRRFGEETLFMALRDHNTSAIKTAGVKRVVTADPHAFNAFRHDYKDVPPVEHISQVVARSIRTGTVKLKPVEDGESVYTYHDPCYLGRHNGVYDEPRYVLDSIPGLKRVEMRRSRDRSFCCGGGGLALFYEPKEDERIGVKRVRMAAEAGANVIVTACPFCMVNIEDAIKVAGFEGKMTAIDVAELVDKHI